MTSAESSSKDIETLIPFLKDKFNLNLPFNYSFLLDFVSRFERNESIWPIIQNLKQKCNLGLLTNMYPNMLNAIFKSNLMPGTRWDIVIDSSVEKVRKPQIEIYQLAQDRSGFAGSEILFIDNKAKNLEPTKSLNWQTFLYDPTNPEKSNEELENFLL